MFKRCDFGTRERNDNSSSLRTSAQTTLSLKWLIHTTMISAGCAVAKERKLWHDVSENTKLAQTDYKRRHDNIARMAQVWIGEDRKVVWTNP